MNFIGLMSCVTQLKKLCTITWHRPTLVSSVKSRMVYPSVTGLPRLFWINAVNRVMLSFECQATLLTALSVTMQWCTLSLAYTKITSFRTAGWSLFLESRGKSWNLVRPFSRPGKSWKIAKVMESHEKSWKIMMISRNYFYKNAKFLQNGKFFILVSIHKSCIVYFEKICCADRKFIFWSWKSWKIIVEKEWSTCLGVKFPLQMPG